MPRLLIALALLAVSASPAAAQAPGHGFSSDNVEFVTNVSTGPTSGARLLGGYFYLTTGRDLRIYDTKNPESPQLTGSVLLEDPGAGEQRAPEEDPDTNGKILLTTNGGGMQVYDVSDKAAPKLLSTLDGVSQHTISCVLDCTFAYGSEGVIVDLRNPAAPKEAGSWFDTTDLSGSHDVTEVAPGYVVTSSQPIALLDVREDPTKPKVLATAEPPGFVHANLWPHEMSDRFLLAGGEATGPGCEDSPAATFMTWDTAGWVGSKTFKLIGEWRMTAGTPNDGAMPGTTFCTHWFMPQPQYRDGGLVGMGWYEDGTRFLKVGLDGKIEEVGYFLPLGGRSSAVYWVSDTIAWTADYYRGIDVLRWKDPLPPSAPAPTPGASPTPPPALPAQTSRATSFSDLIRMPKRCGRGRTLAISVRKHRDPATSVLVRVNGKKKLSAKGKSLRKALKLRRLPRRGFSVQVFVRTRSGHETAGQRRYRGCS